MTFQNIKPSRVIMAVITIWGLSVVLTFLISCATTPFMPADMGERALEYVEIFTDPNADTGTIEEERASFWSEFGAELTVQYIIQWALVALVIFWMAARLGRQADSPQQATGYGVAVALGVAISYGLLCACLPALALGSSSLVLIAGVFTGLFIAAGYYGGRSVTQVPPPRPADVSGIPTFTRQEPAISGLKPETAYNMGVQAALGGRREEARQHFTRVLQMQPRNVAAWLQLANLADTPEQAWNYVQQARSISPNDPAVQEAVNIIWPQVAANAEKRDLPHNQPPYRGGQQDDSAIPRTRLSGSSLDTPDQDAEFELLDDDTEFDLLDDEYDDQPGAGQ